MAYDYYRAVKEDAKDYIVENMEYWDFEDSLYFAGETPTAEELYDMFNDELWAVDAVTGNGPNAGYYIYDEDARKSIFGNEELLIDALEEYGDDPESYKKALTNPHYSDATIRCYLLGQVLIDAVDELLAEKAFPFQKSKVKSKSKKPKTKAKAKAKPKTKRKVR